MTMDELPRMRIELEQLKKRERDLDEELFRVRAKIEAHNSRIEHLNSRLGQNSHRHSSD